MKSAVSLNPCGHELDEKCAQGILSSSSKNCPVCLADVNSFRPAYITRQVIDKLFPNIQHPELTIIVHRLSGEKHTYKVERNSKTIDLFKLIFSDTKIHPSLIKLVHREKSVSPFNHLNEYIPHEESEVHCYMTERFGHWSSKAEEFPLIYKQAVAEVGANSNELPDRFLNLHREAINKAMNS
jgi:hypothetical protein